MSDFKLVNLVDSQLEDITSEVTLPVITGAQSNNFQTFNAQSGIGSSQIQFNVQVPSLATAVNRHFLVQTDIALQVDFDGGTTAKKWEPNAILFSYGRTNSLQAFPLNALLSTIQSNLNNATVSVNTRDVMAALLKMYNYEELAKYNSLTPSLIDSFYQNYVDGLGSNNNVIANYSVGTFSKEYQPRGVFPVTLWTTDGTQIDSLTIKADENGTSPYASIILKFTTTEPLLFLSPYRSGNCNNYASFLGLNNLTITMNLGDATRVMSNASYALLADESTSSKTISNVSLSAYSNAKLLLNFLTIPPVLMAKIEPKNVVNYNQYTAYNYSPSTVIAGEASSQLSFNNIQLNQIPSKILIFAKKAQQTTYDSNFFMVISKVSINFANKSGLLSSANQVQLYDMSVKNGLQMNFYEFSGSGISNNEDGDPVLVPTIGSILCVDPAIDLSIESQYTNMSAGQYNMQFDITFQNQTKEAITPTLYLVVVNSGVFITENGTSSFNTGLLTQEMVLDTKAKEAVMDKQTYEEDVVGGSIENIGSIHKHMKLNFHKATAKEHDMDQGPGAMAPRIGSGMSGSGMSASGMSGSSMPAPRGRRIHKHLVG
ncbi:MAG: hypothetical protein EOO89_17705 [Pedobacter sp.]|nr:MAG: hypothetical protein EOO89_17705 [Pedobacter sp.]